MPDIETTTSLPGAIRLLALLAGDPPTLTDAIHSEVLAMGRERAGRIVAAIIDEELASPDGDPVALNATVLAFALGLVEAIPVLVRCVERLEPGAPLARAASAALARMGPEATAAILARLDRAPAAAHLQLAAALAETRAQGEQVLDALGRVLERDPDHGSLLLARYGDRRALPLLAAALDRAALRPAASSPAEPLRNDDVISLAMAIEELGGVLTPAQELKRVGALRILADDLGCGGQPFMWHGSTTRELPGRNDPCPCGSGKKYKRCHLAENERAGRA